MAFSTDLYIVQKGTTTKIQVGGNKQGDVHVATRLPPYLDLVNAGKVFEALDTTTNAALVARPTTVAGLTVQNPASSNKTYVIWSIKAYMDVVPATLSTVTAWHCVSKLAAAAFTRDLVLAGTGAGTALCLKGGVSYTGSAIFDRGATVVDDGWVPIPLTIVGNIATTDFHAAESALVTPVILPSGQHYSLQATSTVITNEVAFGITWAELDDADWIS